MIQWLELDDAAVSDRDKCVGELASYLISSYPTLDDSGALPVARLQEFEYLQWLYYEGLLTGDEADRVELAICLAFGGTLASDFEMKWCFRSDDAHALEFGVRFDDSEYVLLLTPVALKAFPVHDVAAIGEETNLSDHMFEIYSQANKGRIPFEKAVSAS